MPVLSPDQWQKISPYLDHALSLPSEERQGWLADFRAKSSELGGLLEQLLEEHRELSEERFLENEPSRSASEPSWTGETLGPYRLLSRIGEGGMGNVWLAERHDGRFERRVAIKFLHFAVASPTAAERFKREGSILGQLAHPHIAELIDAGVTRNGEPYLVLEYVEGKQIDEWCDEHRLDVKARLGLFLDVLNAVSHAHASLVVHRDIKPTNVLVRRDGVVKLLDFGIAKLLAGDANSGLATQLTLEGGGALTPRYAAPEQVTGRAITTATDVYALGTLLYVLLAGRHPLGSGSLSPAEIVKSIVDIEPVRPSQTSVAADAAAVAEKRGTTPEKLRRQIRGDLDTIVGKALKKNPAERYVSVEAFADDVRRFLRHEPIGARPDTLVYRTRKFVRRNLLAVALSGVAFAAACAGVAGILIQTHTAREQRDFALRQASRADAVSDLENFILVDAASGGRPFTLDELLHRAEHIVTREHVADDTDRVELLISIGRHYWGADEDVEAARVLQQAYDASRKLSDPSVRAKASCALASSLARAGESDRAEVLVNEGLREIPDQPQYAPDRFFCLLRGREVADHNGAAQLGLDRVLQVQRAMKQSPFSSEISEWHIEMELAESYRNAGRLREAIRSFEHAFSLMTELGRDDTESASTLLNNWALALEFNGNPLEAQKRFAQSIQLDRGSHGEQAVSPTLLINNAHVLKELARTKEAEDYAQRGYKRAVELGDQEAINQAILELARIYRQEGRVKGANAMLDEVEPKLRRNLPAGHYAFASLASERALNAQAAGDLRTASRFAKEAWDILEAAIRKGGEGSQYLPILRGRQSDLDLRLGQPDQAAADAAAELSLAQKNVEPGQYSAKVGHAYLDLGMALRAQGKADEARSAFRSAADHLERTLGPDHPDSRTVRQLAGVTSR